MVGYQRNVIKLSPQQNNYVEEHSDAPVCNLYDIYILYKYVF